MTSEPRSRGVRSFLPARRAAQLVLTGALVLSGVSGCVAPPAGQPGTAPPSAAAPGDTTTGTTGASPPPVPELSPGDGSVAPTAGEAAIALAGLPVKGRAQVTGYARTRFGPAWVDVDGDGCDQRNQVLARDMTDEVFRRGNGKCIVSTGRLVDPYTGRVISFRRGNKTSEAVQIDHVVALGNAWKTGAQALDEPTLRLLANDPLNLLAVDGPTNQAKGDSDAASWLPPNKSFRCAYVSRQVAVKQRYRLWVTPPERAAIERVLAGCIGQPLVR